MDKVSTTGPAIRAEGLLAGQGTYITHDMSKGSECLYRSRVRVMAARVCAAVEG